MKIRIRIRSYKNFGEHGHYRTFEFQRGSESHQNCTNFFTLLEEGLGLYPKNGEWLEVTVKQPNKNHVRVRAR